MQPKPKKGEKQRLKSSLRGMMIGVWIERRSQDRRFLVSRMVMSTGVRAPRAAGFGACTKRLVHDLLDGPRATSALGTASEATVNLPRRAWHGTSRTHRIADVVV